MIVIYICIILGLLSIVFGCIFGYADWNTSNSVGDGIFCLAIGIVFAIIINIPTVAILYDKHKWNNTAELYENKYGITVHNLKDNDGDDNDRIIFTRKKVQCSANALGGIGNGTINLDTIDCHGADSIDKKLPNR